MSLPPLLNHHRAQLRASAISDEVITERGYYSATKISDLKRRGLREVQCSTPSIAMPTWNVLGEPDIIISRPDNPRINQQGKRIKYEVPSGAQMIVDVPRRSRRLLGDPATPLLITEGIKKGDSAVSNGFLCAISLLGVWNWRGTNEDGGKTVLADLDHIAFNGRPVLFAFDSDVMQKWSVYRALVRFSAVVERRGGKPRYIYLPDGPNGEKVGLDDFLAAGHTQDDVLALAEEDLRPPLEPEEREGEHSVGLYRETPKGLFYQRPTQSGPVPVQLTNFVARIVGDVAEDDGVEVRHVLEVRAALPNRVRDARLTPEKFAAMSWPMDVLGASAIVYAGQAMKDHSRAAIQLFSPEIPERTVYAHSGWREHAGEWVYLHAGGAIGGAGAVVGVEVALPGDLANACLPSPPEGDELREAIRGSLSVVGVAPEGITIPLLAGIYRAALGGTDFSLALIGPTGIGKSELAALAQQHFGARFDARHLPANFSSTANALEGLLFVAKDMALVIDDFAPGGSQADVQRLNRDAERVLRGQGNHAGRQRMNADARLRVARPSRALPLITGEDVPRGQSARARALVVEVGPGDLDWPRLTACQSQAREGRYAEAMAAFLRWVAPQYAAIQSRLIAETARLRDLAAESRAHRRTPAIAGSLGAAWRIVLDFAVESGAITAGQAESAWRRGWAALGAAATAQGKHQSDSEPVARFLALLDSAVASGAAHVADKDGNAPDPPRRWGWRAVQVGGGEFERREWRPQGTRIGWVDGDNIYLERDAALAVSQELGRKAGDGLVVSGQTLAKRLHEKGLLASIDQGRETLTVRRRIEGGQRRVLHLQTAAIFPDSDAAVDAGDEPPSVIPF